MSSIASQPNSPQRRGLLVSLTAKGNPQVCLLGGLLLVCLAGIGSLIGIIAVNGVSAFQVRSVDLIRTRSNELFFAQLQAIEQQDKGEGQGTAQAFQYRTSNPTLSGIEYQWLSKSELLGDAARPKLAMLIERFEIGRLFGIPIKLRLSVFPSARSVELARMCATLIEYSAQEDSEFALDDGIVERLLQLATLEVEADFNAQKEKWINQGAQAEQIDAPNNELLQPSSTDNTDAAAKTQVAVPQTTVFWDSPRRVVDQLQTGLTDLRRLSRRADSLSNSIANFDATISNSRLKLRALENKLLSMNSNLIDDCQARIGALVQFRAELRRFRGNQLSGLVGFELLTDQPLIQAKNEFIEQVLATRIEKLELAQANWLNEVEASLSGQETDQLESYSQDFERIESQKLPLQTELRQLERTLDSYELELATPKSAALLEASNEDLERLGASDLSDPLRQWIVQQLGHEDQPASIQLKQLHSARERFGLWQFDLGSNPCLLVMDQRNTNNDTGAIWLWTTERVSGQSVARATLPNEMSWFAKQTTYADRWWEFLTTSPRLANTEGGVFPAIVGMAALTLIMTIAVLPLGVMAALYLSEYTSSGALVSAIRISINNLASVPSIIYGAFGFSFFCYTIGAFIDGGPQNASISVLPPVAWYTLLFVCASLATTAFFIGLNGSKKSSTNSQSGQTSRMALIVAVIAAALMILLIVRSPFFEGFYSAQLPNPTFGKGGLLWAALTLALMNLPVVIVSTEEALTAVPKSLREGSYACGASRWQTIRRIVLPYAKPGIVTGAVLAMARGCSVVAPLLLVGALPTVSGLPIDGQFPYVHGSRGFSHLGYWIFSLGAQNPNSDSTRTMVFASALLLLIAIMALNLLAVYWRRRLRSKDVAGY